MKPSTTLHQLRRSKAALKDALKEALGLPPPLATVSPEAAACGFLDQLAMLDDRGLFLRGWLHQREQVTSLTLTSPTGERVDLRPRLRHHRRADVEARFGPAASGGHGFLAYVELERPTALRDGFSLELKTRGGTRSALPGPAATVQLEVIRELLLEALTVDRDPSVLGLLAPAFDRLQKRMSERAQVTQEVTFGAPPGAPEVSIIIPLYRRIDFLEHQLAQFAQDPGLRCAELLYVLDSPADAEPLLREAEALVPHYQVPIRVLVLNQNCGYAMANNIGAAHARSGRLLLLNSDVLPDRQGWLGPLRAIADRPSIGAVGAQLVYEDESIQHAGMYFTRATAGSHWRNAHYFKGMHRSLAAANQSRRVPAVTGACLLTRREVFESVGGLSTIYVFGDFEDSDYCLKLAERGLSSWYCAQAGLYHLEGQSYPGPLRQRAFQFNSWIHTQRWSPLIEQVQHGFA